ncbi:MAG: Asp-tRNA(Asn)/Glu-tRNA(Gln) amidotransferase subunit GatC [Terracidiphilus sp.]
MTAKVTKEVVDRVAELAHLELKPEETTRMLTDLNAILDYVAELNALDTSGVEPLAQVSELGDFASQPRSDVREPSLLRSVVMPEAPETDGVFFKVLKVIER